MRLVTFFVEDTFIAKTLEVKFEALELNAQAIWHVAKGQHAKVGLARFGAYGGKLGAGDLDRVFAI